MQVLDLHISTFLSDPPKREPVHATRKHSTPPPYAVPNGIARWEHATPAISHSQCVVVFSRNGIAQVFGLSGYVVSTAKSQLKQVYNGRSLIDTEGASTTRQPCRLNHQKHIPCPVRSPFPSIFIFHFQDIPWVKAFVNDKLITWLLSAKHGQALLVYHYKRVTRISIQNIKADMQQLVFNHFLLLSAHIIGLKW
jgi:hypothetical protein